MDENAILDAMEPIESWFARDEGALLLSAAERSLHARPDAAIVEVGSFCGRSTIVLASAVRALGAPARVYAIDPHQGELTGAGGPERAEPTLDRFLHNVRSAGVDGCIEVLQMASTDVRWSGPIGLLFIDGLHTYEAVKSDFEHFEASLAPGSLVAFHDYAPELFPGVVRWVDSVAERSGWRRWGAAGTLAVLERV